MSSPLLRSVCASYALLSTAVVVGLALSVGLERGDDGLLAVLHSTRVEINATHIAMENPLGVAFYDRPLRKKEFELDVSERASFVNSESFENAIFADEDGTMTEVTLTGAREANGTHLLLAWEPTVEGTTDFGLVGSYTGSVYLFVDASNIIISQSTINRFFDVPPSPPSRHYYYGDGI